MESSWEDTSWHFILYVFVITGNVVVESKCEGTHHNDTNSIIEINTLLIACNPGHYIIFFSNN